MVRESDGEVFKLLRDALNYPGQEEGKQALLKLSGLDSEYIKELAEKYLKGRKVTKKILYLLVELDIEENDFAEIIKNIDEKQINQELNECGLNLLIYAFAKEKSDLVNALVKSGKLDKQSIDIEQLFRIAYKKNNPKLFCAVLEHLTYEQRNRDDIQNLIMYFTAMNQLNADQADIVKAALFYADKNKIDQPLNDDGDTLLLFAAYKVNTSVIALLELGADPLKKNIKGLSPLRYALNNNAIVANIMLKHLFKDGLSASDVYEYAGGIGYIKYGVSKLLESVGFKDQGRLFADFNGKISYETSTRIPEMIFAGLCVWPPLLLFGSWLLYGLFYGGKAFDWRPGYQYISQSGENILSVIERINENFNLKNVLENTSFFNTQIYLYNKMLNAIGFENTLKTKVSLIYSSIYSRYPEYSVISLKGDSYLPALLTMSPVIISLMTVGLLAGVEKFFPPADF